METTESWMLRGGAITLDRPRVMGVLNLTPDSFSDGGRLPGVAAAVARGRELAAAGADLLDVGGESTRPGALPVAPDEEAARVLPVVRALVDAVGIPVSVDTRRAAVAHAALEAGAAAVNDVSGLGDPGMAAVVAESGAGLVLMHMRGTPETMRSLATYTDVVEEVADELAGALARAAAAGIAPERTVVDPGLGFAKTAEQSMALVAGLPRLLARLRRPVLLGPSRKSFLAGPLGGLPPEERDAGTAGACVAGLLRGARLFRVHDVRTARHALDVSWAIAAAGEGS